MQVQRKVPIDDVSLALDLRSELEEFRTRASELAELSNTQKKTRRNQNRKSGNSIERGSKVVSQTLDYHALEDEKLETPEMVRKEMVAQKKALLMELFRRSGPAKLPAIERRVSELLNGVDEDKFSGKLLVFAHHRKVLDTLADGILRHVKYIRIDGTTPAKDRQSRVSTFQNDAEIRVALLGITAAGIALTLTAASRVIFTELYWTPAALLQAEDRAHRIGQTSEVVVEYLLADDCVDEILWPLIQHKMLMLGELFENKKDQRLHSSNDKIKKINGGIKRKGIDDGDDSDFESNDGDGALVQLDELEELHHEDPEAIDLEHDNDETNGHMTPPPQQLNRRSPDADISKMGRILPRREEYSLDRGAVDEETPASIVASLLDEDNLVDDF